jgi:hypothetical protein
MQLRSIPLRQKSSVRLDQPWQSYGSAGRARLATAVSSKGKHGEFVRWRTSRLQLEGRCASFRNMKGVPPPGTDHLRAPVLIIGAHRSGTTATVQALKLLGLQIGQRLDSHDEPRELQRLHEDYLHGQGASWHDPAAFLDSMRSAQGAQACVEYLRENLDPGLSVFGYRKNLLGLWLKARLRFGKAWGWKEPRTTLFAHCWLELFPQARLLHIVRNPLAVATSLQKRELEFQAKGDAPSGRLQDFNYCLSLAVTYVEVGEALAKDTPHYRRIRFEDIQADPTRQLSKAAQFCELRFTPAQIKRAAATIWPQIPDTPDHISKARELLAQYPVAIKLGYGGDSP